ncbi:hypothetical protein M3231_10655 [Neobacillus mesonae]|nr:hypothetical protein [Neobacillus mesonae]
MKIKAVFLDFYGTLVHEDDDILPLIYEQIQISAGRECTHREIGSYWWRAASSMYDESFGDAYRLQRDIGIQSLADTLQFYGSSLASEELISTQFDHWAKPVLYEDTLPFIAWLRSEGIRSYILSNIDTADVLSAVDFYGIEVDGIITRRKCKIL